MIASGLTAAKVAAAPPHPDIRHHQLDVTDEQVATEVVAACPRIDALVLISETEVKKRRGLVRQFQEEDDVRFFALSVKAGGAGLNLPRGVACHPF